MVNLLGRGLGDKANNLSSQHAHKNFDKMIGKSLLLLQIVCSCLASQDASSDPVTYEQLYGDGEDAYWNESWSDSITHLRGAVDVLPLVV